MTGVFFKKGNVTTDIYMGTMPCEDEDRDQNNAFTSQRIPEISTNLQKIG